MSSNLRLNQNCDTIDGIKEYYNNRAIQLLKYGIHLDGIIEDEAGCVASFISDDLEVYHSIYLLSSQRGKNLFDVLYKKYGLKNIITSDDCNLYDFLDRKGYPFRLLNFSCIQPYKFMENFYGDKKAERSGAYYMNHLDEGLAILMIALSDDYFCLYENNHIQFHYAAEAYTLHPFFQMDKDLLQAMDYADFYNGDNNIFHPLTVTYAMEYRRVANAYLSNRKITSLDEIELSCLPEVNFMLMADKIQNRKDFELYHKGIHPRSEELEQYFKNWLDKLGVSEERYQCIKNYLTVKKIQ